MTRQALRDAIDALPPFYGVTGMTEFVDGTPDKELTLLQIKNGAYPLFRRQVVPVASSFSSRVITNRAVRP